MRSRTLQPKISSRLRLWGGGKFVVKNDGVAFVGLAELGELLRLAAANECAGDRGFELLQAAADDFSTGCRGQFGQFVEGIAGLPG